MEYFADLFVISDMDNITKIKTVQEFDALVANSDKPVMVDFWATWCPPCRMMEPILDKFADENDSTVTVAKVDVDDIAELAQRYQITSIPSILTFNKGELDRERIIGAVPARVLENKLNTL